MKLTRCSFLSRFVPSIWIGMACLVLCISPVVRAGEVTRQVQEELRKRDLFFGNIDGRTSAALSAALRRYQELKGFASTGESDEQTLVSLNLLSPGEPSATPGASPAPSVSPWPDIPVLRSDEARLSPVSNDTPTHSTPAPPPAAAVVHPLAAGKAQEFVAQYLAAGEANDTEAEMRFYAEHVAYYDEGKVDHRYIAHDVTKYDRRWPQRRFELLSPVSVAPAADGEANHFEVTFRYGFAVKNARFNVRGKVDSKWIVTAPPGGGAEWEIVGMQEQRVRDS